MIFCNGFIGSNFKSRILEFSSSDSKPKFEKNLQEQPQDWYYRNTQIIYNYNDNGHRSKPISEIDFDNYILFTGCSHTEGIGIELEKTYAYLLAKNLNTDYYNLAVQGTGIDVIEYNLLLWFAKYKKRPKFVVIQYPDHSRYLGKYPGYENFIPNGSWVTDDDHKKFVGAAELSGFYNARKNISYRLIHGVIDVPIIGIYLGSLSLYDSKGIPMRRLDLARDLQHSGIKTNSDVAKRLLDHIHTLNI